MADGSKSSDHLAKLKKVSKKDSTAAAEKAAKTLEKEMKKKSAPVWTTNI